MMLVSFSSQEAIKRLAIHSSLARGRTYISAAAGQDSLRIGLLKAG